MKKAVILLFVLLLLAVSYLIYDELSYDPLNKSDFAKIFVGYNGKKTTLCKKDFLGVALRGESFELYVYSLDNVTVKSNYPQFTRWENSNFTKETIVGKWKNCPINKDVMYLYKFTLTSQNLSSSDCSNSFNSEISNPQNFYSFISISDTEQYFLLYSPLQNKLYYIRRRGF